MDLAELDALFDRFERSAFRVEARDHYDVANESEEFAAFLAGGDLRQRTPDNDPWLALVARATADGRSVERVRIVGIPLSDYSRYEFACYPANAAAGERIRVVPRHRLRGSDRSWASRDFWIFDDATVALLNYDADGRFLGAEMAKPVDEYLDAKRRALGLAIDLARFLDKAN